MLPAWREFELLVARIEAVLVPLGASIKSPDRLPDRISGGLREVDAAIRYPLGDGTALVTLECRDRQSVEDNTWIEQLVTKRASIGATRTIAVSSSGFSEPAQRKAAHFGIETRVMRDLEPTDVVGLLRLHFEERCFHSVLHSLRLNIRQVAGDDSPPELAPETFRELRANPSDARIFQRTGRGPVSWNDMYRLLQSRDWEALYASVPEDGKTSFTKVHLNISDELLVNTVLGLRAVGSLDALVELRAEDRTAKMTVNRTSEYAGPERSIAHAVAYSADSSVGRIDVVSVTPVHDGQTHLSVAVTRKTDA